MKNQKLINDIKEATTSEELETIVEAIKRQPNGFKTSLAQHLGDAFWYDNMTNNVELQKKFILKVVASY